MHNITQVNDTIYYITVVSDEDDEPPTNIKLFFKEINSQEEPKYIELDHDFIKTHNFKGRTEYLKMHIADNNKAYLYFYYETKPIIEVYLATQKLASIPVQS